MGETEEPIADSLPLDLFVSFHHVRALFVLVVVARMQRMWSTYLDSAPGHEGGVLEGVSSPRPVSARRSFYYVNTTHGTNAYCYPTSSHFSPPRRRSFSSKNFMKPSLVRITILLV